MAVTNNLFPPIIDTYMPAFLVDSGDIERDRCKIYFSISNYNSLKEIANAQITVSDQNTNLSVLDENKYPSNIKITSIYEDNKRLGNDKYYIIISKDDIINGTFEINKYYKVQIRFTSIDATNPPITTNSQPIDSWLSENLDNFSEWSTICLIRGISTPTLNIHGLDLIAEYTEWNSGNIDIIGNLTFLNPEETERLRSYDIKVYNFENELIIDTEELYGSNYVNINQLNYTLKYMFEEGEKYKIVIHYTTTNLYEETLTYMILVLQGGTKRLDATITTTLDEENSRIGIYVHGNTSDMFTGNVMIRRTDSKSNFTIWEDVHLERLEKETLDFTWYDNTVESGIWYYYCAQQINNIGQRSIIIRTRNPVMLLFDDMFLTVVDKQLKIKFDPQITSYQRTVLESKTDTIGSKYPFVKRNGYANYRQFQISGTISHFIDRDGLLISRENMYDNSETIINLYDDFNWENRIGPHNDYTYERDFREKVMDFLYDNTVKLFRSATEGNILVKLMNITWNPNQTLGRMIYTFNATAYETDEATIDNYKNYNIINIESYLNNFFEVGGSHLGQIQGAVAANQDVLELLEEKYQKNANPGYIVHVDYLDSLRIEMQDEPYLIKDTGNGPEILNDVILTRTMNDIDVTNTILGYLVYINNLPIVINSEGIYELSADNLQITSLYFPIDTNVDLNFHVQTIESEDVDHIPKTQNFYNKVGQCWGVFDYKDSIYKKLWNKYNEQYSTYSQNLVEIDGINVEADPGSVIYVREANEQDYDRHIIGESCRLSFQDEDSLIEGMYFAGIHMEEATNWEAQKEWPIFNKYIETGIITNSIDAIENPILNGVYTITGDVDSQSLNEFKIEDNIINIDNKEYDLSNYDLKTNFKKKITREIQNSRKYIYHNYKWWTLTEDYDMICSVPAIVDYYYSIVKGTY